MPSDTRHDDAYVGRLVDYRATARRMRRSAVILLSLAVVGWLVSSVGAGELRPGGLGGWIGAALGGMFVVELVVVGGSAVRGMLAAGDQGERLAGSDVGLLPTQIRRRRARR